MHATLSQLAEQKRRGEVAELKHMEMLSKLRGLVQGIAMHQQATKADVEVKLQRSEARCTELTEQVSSRPRCSWALRLSMECPCAHVPVARYTHTSADQHGRKCACSCDTDGPSVEYHMTMYRSGEWGSKPGPGLLCPGSNLSSY